MLGKLSVAFPLINNAASEGGGVKVREDFISSLIGLGLGLYWVVRGSYMAFGRNGPSIWVHASSLRSHCNYIKRCPIFGRAYAAKR